MKKRKPARPAPKFVDAEPSTTTHIRPNGAVTTTGAGPVVIDFDVGDARKSLATVAKLKSSPGPAPRRNDDRNIEIWNEFVRRRPSSMLKDTPLMARIGA